MARLPRLIRTRLESLGNSSDSSRKQIDIFRDILEQFSYFIMKCTLGVLIRIASSRRF